MNNKNHMGSKAPRHLLGRITLLSLTVAALGACTTTPGINASPSDSAISTQAATVYAYANTVQVATSDTQAGVLKTYGGGKVYSWHPELGFAIIGQSNALVIGGKVLGSTKNRKTNKVSEVGAAGFGAWSGGWTAWSGGFGAWSGGFGAWSGGTGTSVSTTNPNASIFDQIHLAQAETYAPNAGLGVTVAVIDTGIDLAHPAFTGHLVASSDMYDWVDGDASPQEGYVSGATNAAFGHGTAVAGIILQIAPNATIMPLRVLDQEGYGDTTNVIAAIDWAVAHGAKVINLSLGSLVNDSGVNNEIKYAYTKGVITVASSGNSGDTNLTYPAAVSTSNTSIGAGLLSVGSVGTATLDVKSGFSTYGSNLEMVAPGESVFSAYPNNQTALATGTSFAAPMVTASFALAIGQGTSLGTNNLATAMGASADSVNLVNPSFSGLLGSGRLNLETFMKKALGLI